MIKEINCMYTDVTVRLANKGKLEKYTVMGEITDDNVVVPFKSDATDGSQVPCCILAQDVENPTDGIADIPNVRIIAIGEINAKALKFTKDGDTAKKFAMTLKNNGILIRNMQKGIGV